MTLTLRGQKPNQDNLSNNLKSFAFPNAICISVLHGSFSSNKEYLSKFLFNLPLKTVLASDCSLGTNVFSPSNKSLALIYEVDFKFMYSRFSITQISPN